MDSIKLYNEISFETSKLLTKKYSTSFSIAVGFLSKEMQDAIYSIYGFVRLADEIVDSFHHVNQEQMLDNFEQNYKDALINGMSMNPVLNSFAQTVKKYNIPSHLIDSFLKSMRIDLQKQTYLNASELDEYIYGSADVVGLMCLMVFASGNDEVYNDLKKPAMKLGSAFQKVNFLRDLKFDIEHLDRSYFPQFDLRNFNEDIKYGLIKDIENDFEQAKLGIKALDGKCKLAVYIAYVYYRQLLRNLKKTPAKNIMKKRIRVSDPLKILLLGKAYVGFKMNLI
jgi:phytoene/squalene synthetase